MLDQRKQQAQTGRLIPQVNEEYGYEDHYPEWNPVAAPGCSADADRRAAWEIAMAGTYQTTGETAKRGTGVPPDTGGGWVNCIIESIFGVRAGLDGKIEATPQFGPFDSSATLENLAYQGVTIRATAGLCQTDDGVARTDSRAA